MKNLNKTIASASLLLAVFGTIGISAALAQGDEATAEEVIEADGGSEGRAARVGVGKLDATWRGGSVCQPMCPNRFGSGDNEPQQLRGLYEVLPGYGLLDRVPAAGQQRRGGGRGAGGVSEGVRPL